MSLLVTVTGRDHPGVMTAFMDALATYDAVVQDVEQVVVHGRLLLGVVIAGSGDGSAVRCALLTAASTLGVDLAFEPLEEDVDVASVRHHVVVLGAPLPPAAFAGVT